MFPQHDDLVPGVANRLERMLAAEGMDRLWTGTIAATSSFVVIAPLLIVLLGLPDAFYYLGLLLVFVALVWLQYLCFKRWPDNDWMDYAFASFNAALLSFTLAVPNPFSSSADDPTARLTMQSDAFIYFFLLPASLALSFSPRLVLWSGICCAFFWSIFRYWVVAEPGSGWFVSRFADDGLWLQDVVVLLIVSAILAAVVQGSRSLLMRRAIEERKGANLARYLPQQMAERMAEADEPFLQDRDADAAVLFTDIVGFTRWAEAHKPGEVLSLLRRVHSLVADEVFRAHGVLDKFIGDGAMATFGVAQEEHAADRALTCAEAILARTAALNRRRTKSGHRPVQMSVGVHYGPVTIGDVGSLDRMEMAVIGDAVNVASRVEALTRKLKCGAAASDAVVRAAGGSRTGWTLRGEQILPGRQGTLAIWTRDLEPDDPARAGEEAETGHSEMPAKA